MFAGQSYGKRFYGGFGIESKKGRSQFAVTNVATEINSVGQVCLCFFSFFLFFFYYVQSVNFDIEFSKLWRLGFM